MEPLKGENTWVAMEIKKHYFHLTYKPNTTLDLAAAKQIIKDAQILANSTGKRYPVLSDIRDMPPHNKDVRDFFANQPSSVSKANAILTSNSLSKILANFFLTLNKPTIPTRLFTDESKAVKWLGMFPVTEM